MRILLVEDDGALRSLLTQRLRAENYAVDAVTDGHYGWEYASTYDYDLLILDVLLPHLDGVTLCKRLRSRDYTLPILLLTAQDTRAAKRIGWDAGADDYVVKPFDEEDLVARVRALLRRSSANPLPTLTWGPLWLDTNTSEVSYDSEVLSLTAKEHALLEMMLRDSQHVFSSEDIIEGLWASEEFPTDATVRSHVRRLRQKLSAAGAPTDLIATSHGRGYYLKPIAPEGLSCDPLDFSSENAGLPVSNATDKVDK
ncbi:MAG: response regulator transcription factor, partial [Elainellaceae cyanobacterium]